MVHPKIALFWGAEKKQSPIYGIHCSIINKPQLNPAMFSTLVSWLTNIVFNNKHAPSSSRRILDIGSSWIGSSVYVFLVEYEPHASCAIADSSCEVGLFAIFD